jgi:hypothetical protein
MQQQNKGEEKPITERSHKHHHRRHPILLRRRRGRGSSIMIKHNRFFPKITLGNKTLETPYIDQNRFVIINSASADCFNYSRSHCQRAVES